MRLSPVAGRWYSVVPPRSTMWLLVGLAIVLGWRYHPAHGLAIPVILWASRTAAPNFNLADGCTTWVLIVIALGAAVWSPRHGLPLAGWAFAAWLIGCIEHRLRMTPIVRVRLLDEGVDVWRPAAAVHLGGDLYRLAPVAPCGSETWEFQPGECVVCAMHQFSEGWALAAVRRADEPRPPGS